MDPERICVQVVPSEIGTHKIHVRFNAVEIPQSPLKFEVCDESNQTSKNCIFYFHGLLRLHKNNIFDFLFSTSDFLL